MSSLQYKLLLHESKGCVKTFILVVANDTLALSFISEFYAQYVQLDLLRPTTLVQTCDHAPKKCWQC